MKAFLSLLFSKQEPSGDGGCINLAEGGDGGFLERIPLLLEDASVGDNSAELALIPVQYYSSGPPRYRNFLCN